MRNRMTIEDRVLAALGRCGDAEPRQLAERLGLVTQAVWSALGRLETKGKVVRLEGQGYKGGDLWRLA